MLKEFIKDGSKLTVRLEGRLDSPAADELYQPMTDAVEGVDELVFDLEKLDYMSSAGLRIMLQSHKNMIACGGMMKIINVNDFIKDIFDITGFSEFVKIEG